MSETPPVQCVKATAHPDGLLIDGKLYKEGDPIPGLPRLTIHNGDNHTVTAKLREFAALIEVCPEPCGMLMKKFEEVEGFGITTIEIQAPLNVVIR